MKKYILLFGAAALALSTNAQNELDALRYSEDDITGTARFMGLSGAMSALGNDLSSITVNPAGVSVFNKTQIGLSTAISGITTQGSFLGNNSEDVKMNFNVGNAGFVARFNRRNRQDGSAGWNGFSMGLNYTRLQSYHRNTYLEGINNNSSLIDQYVNQAQGTPYTNLDQFGEGAAWSTWLIDTTAGSTSNYIRNVLDNYGQEQRITESTRGFKGQTDLTFGGNYANTLFIGGSIGYQNISFRSERNHTEYAPLDTSSTFNEFTRTDYLSASGSGVNLKFGIIYRPLDWLRLGASIHSPTFFNIEENYSSTMSSSFDSVNYEYASPEGSFRYKLQTPFRAIGGIAFVVARAVVVSAEYEHVDYSLARLRSNDYGFTSENQNVRSLLKPVGNIRAGIEVKLKSFLIRGGFGMNSDPYSGVFSLDDSKYSLGLGYKGRHFLFDVAYQIQRERSQYIPYDVSLIEPSNVTVESHNVMVSVGVRF